MNPDIRRRRGATDHLINVAARKLGAGTDWHWSGLEAIGDAFDTRVTMGPSRVVRGERTWSSIKSCVVSVAEWIAEAERYELETGNCRTCLGTSKVIASVSRDGTRWRICPDCGAKSPVVAETPEPVQLSLLEATK